jgi:mannose-6-phosphate isomerase-like protein (cupin superfamily)
MATGFAMAKDDDGRTAMVKIEPDEKAGLWFDHRVDVLWQQIEMAVGHE